MSEYKMGRHYQHDLPHHTARTPNSSEQQSGKFENVKSSHHKQNAFSKIKKWKWGYNWVRFQMVHLLTKQGKSFTNHELTRVWLQQTKQCVQKKQNILKICLSVRITAQRTVCTEQLQPWMVSKIIEKRVIQYNLKWNLLRWITTTDGGKCVEK